MLNWILVLAVAFFSIDAKASSDTEATPESAPTCEEQLEHLQSIYQRLYDLDTRPLDLNEYKKFREALRDLASQIQSHGQVCISPDRPTFLVKSSQLKWTPGSSWDNPCGRADLRRDLQSFSETAIRECFSEGHATCEIERPARVKSIAGERGQNQTSWACTAELDVVLRVAR